MNMAQTNPFEHFWNLGFKTLLPLIPIDAELTGHLSKTPKEKLSGTLGKAPGYRYENGKWGFFRDWNTYDATRDDLDKWFRQGANVGFRIPEDMIAIDIDASDKETAEKIEAATLEAFGPSPVRVGNAPRRMLFYRTPEAFKYQSIQFDGPDGPEKVEIMGPGRQVVLYGMHPKTGKKYEWPVRPFKHDDLALVDNDAYEAWFDKLSSALPRAQVIKEKGSVDRENIDQSKLVGETKHVVAAMRALPNNRDIFPDRRDYIKIGAAVKAALPHDPVLAFQLWTEWAAKDNGGVPEVWTKDWNGLGDTFEVGARLIYDLAHEHSGGVFDKTDLHLQALPDTEIELNPSKTPQSKFKSIGFYDAASSALDDMADPLIKGLLDQGAMSVLYGDSNVGKTFVAMDMAYHIATGLPYAGMRTQQMGVLYVAMEGGRGASKRIEALKAKYKPGTEPPFRLLKSAVDLRNPKTDLNAFIEMLAGEDSMHGFKVGLVVVDTLTRALAGGDDNSVVDMGALVTNVGAIQKAIDTHVMIVHHTGKDRAKGARGHSSLRAATDTEIEVSEGLIEVTKQRDLDKAWSTAFSLDVHKLGLDRDGDPVTSCTVRLDAASAVRKREATEGELAVLDAIETISETSDKPDKGARTKDLEVWCKDNLSGMTRDTLNQHIRGLRAKGLISQKLRGFWLSERRIEGEDLLGDCEQNIFD